MTECPDSETVTTTRAACRRALRDRQTACQVRQWFRQRPGERADVDRIVRSTGLAHDTVQGVLIDLCISGDLVQKMRTVYALPD